jgi:hypothetical protein
MQGFSEQGINFRNIIINGDMSIAQRATSVSSTGDGYKTCDRWRYERGVGTIDLSQSSTVPTGQGFAKSFKVDVTGTASPSAGDVMTIEQRIEGQNLQYLKKGTSSAESTTLSFWVRSTKTGTYICELQDVDNSRSISKSYTISSSDTWEKKTITFAGDTTGAFGNDNGRSLDVIWYLSAGSNYTSGTLQTSWGSKVDANRAVGQVNFADNTSNDFYLTGCQLETGTLASDFEFLPFDVNYQRCARYYYVFGDKRGTANPATEQRGIGVGVTHYVNQVICEITVPTIMRTHPSYDQITGTDYFVYYHDQTNDYFDSFVGFAQLGNRKIMVRNTNQISASLGTCGQVYINDTNAFAALDAEL